MADKLINIPNDDTQNYPFSRLQFSWLNHLDTQLNEPTNQNWIKVSKVVVLENVVIKLWGLAQ